jgi:predicted anti-sigma-YlaC factor YlaD
MNDRAGNHVRAELERYYDAETDREDLDAHLDGCADCRGRLEAVQARLRDLACRDVVELITDYLEGSVDGRLRSRVDDHLVLCQGCGEYLREIRRCIALAGALGASEAGGAPRSQAESIPIIVIAAFRARARTDREGHPPN